MFNFDTYEKWHLQVKSPLYYFLPLSGPLTGIMRPQFDLIFNAMFFLPLSDAGVHAAIYTYILFN